MDVFQDAINAAKSVMAQHIEALNNRDEHALLNTLHFPHHRLSGTRLKTWPAGAEYFADFKARAGSDWGYSEAHVLAVLGASTDKVHLDVEIRRFRPDGTLIKSFKSLWVFVQVDGRWGAAFRSSFAGD
ncbi:MAG: hypothetical protein AAF429_10275 [Pseudomonadota bacterium]